MLCVGAGFFVFRFFSFFFVSFIFFVTGSVRVSIFTIIIISLPGMTLLLLLFVEIASQQRAIFVVGNAAQDFIGTGCQAGQGARGGGRFTVLRIDQRAAARRNDQSRLLGKVGAEFAFGCAKDRLALFGKDP